MRGRVLLTLFFFATTDLKLRITITSFNRRGWLRKYVLILTKRNAWPTKLYRKNFHFSIFKNSHWYQAIIRNLKPLFVLCILAQKHLLKNMISDFKTSKYYNVNRFFDLVTYFERIYCLESKQGIFLGFFFGNFLTFEA